MMTTFIIVQSFCQLFDQLLLFKMIAPLFPGQRRDCDLISKDQKCQNETLPILPIVKQNPSPQTAKPTAPILTTSQNESFFPHPFYQIFIHHLISLQLTSACHQLKEISGKLPVLHLLGQLGSQKPIFNFTWCFLMLFNCDCKEKQVDCHIVSPLSYKIFIDN